MWFDQLRQQLATSALARSPQGTNSPKAIWILDSRIHALGLRPAFGCPKSFLTILSVPSRTLYSTLKSKYSDPFDFTSDFHFDFLRVNNLPDGFLNFRFNYYPEATVIYCLSDSR